MKTEKYNISGMTCAACQANITRNVSDLPGVNDVNVSLLANQMTVTYDEAKLTSEEIITKIDKIGYGAAPQASCLPDSGQAVPTAGYPDFRTEWNARTKRAQDERSAMKRRLITSLILLVPLMYIAMGDMMGLPVPGIFTGIENALVNALTQLLITVPILLINRHFYQSGFKALVRRSPNMDSLVATGSSAAFLYGLFSMFRMAYGFGHGDMELVHAYAHELYFESAAMIVTLVTVGKFLEARSKSKTSDALGKLVDLAPKTAVVIRNGEEQTIPAEQVVAGDILIIRPGESIPVDGVILEGNGYLDQAAITGESIPVEKGVGDTVISASINKNGTFRFQASRVGSDTTLAQIIRLVDEASNTKAPIARLADKVSGVFVPVVIGIALITAVIWLLVGKPFEFALSCAIAVLVISCPCALGLATPVAIMVGTGKAAEYGILIKSAESLELLHSVDTIVLDKTGTITSGHPTVTDILVMHPELTADAFLAEAAAAESGSEHPLAEAVVEKAREKGIYGTQKPNNITGTDRNFETSDFRTVSGHNLEISDFRAISGRGITVTVAGHKYVAGNVAFMKEQFPDRFDLTAFAEHAESFAASGKTPLLFMRDDTPAGIIAVADTIRGTSRHAIKAMQEMGLSVVMLTGDNKLTAEAIRTELAIGEVISDVLPTEKEAHIRALQEAGHRVAMVGDGINDAPALTRADIGIAIGAGTDIAIDSADVVLMKDSLFDVVTAIELSHSVIRNIRMNLFWAFFYNILGIPVAAGALFPIWSLRLSPMLGSAAMSLSSVCVVTNALRLRFFKSKTVSASKADLDKSICDGDEIQTAQKSDCGCETQSAQKSSCDCETQSTQKSDCGCKLQTAQKGGSLMKKTLVVDGMMCMHCKAHVEKALAAVNGVTEYTVSLEDKTAVVTLSKEVADEVLIAAITEAGYTVVSCK